MGPLTGDNVSGSRARGPREVLAEGLKIVSGSPRRGVDHHCVEQEFFASGTAHGFTARLN
jgi:hypothetical protein